MTRVADLTGAELALWVARANGLTINPDVCQPDDGVFVGEGCGDLEFFAPHEDWAQGGPLIHQYDIEVAITRSAIDDSKCWCAMMFNDECDLHQLVHQIGRTPLIAAMRALVSSKFGETVEVAPCTK